MRFVGFSVENYKAIRSELSIASLKMANCLIGPNNEGKSSILEALRLLTHLTSPLGQNDTEARESFNEILPDKALDNQFKMVLKFVYSPKDINPTEVQVDAESGTILYTVSWGGQVEGAVQSYMNIVGVEMTRIGEPLIEVVVKNDSGPTYRTMRGGLKSIFENSSSTPRDDFNPQDIRQRLSFSDGDVINQEWGVVKYLAWWASKFRYIPSNREITPRGSMSADTTAINGESLPSMLQKMNTNRRPDFLKFNALICQLIPSIKEVHTFTEEDGSTSIRISQVADIAAEQAYRLDTVGTGVQEIFFLAASIWLSPDASVVLIEEPERGLHPASQRLLINSAILHALEHDKQLFWTTHSTVMAPLTPECLVHVVAMSPEQATITAAVVEDDSSPILLAIGHRIVDFYNYDVLLLFDGETENAVLPPIIDHILGEKARSIQTYSLNGDLFSKKELVTALIKSLLFGSTKVFIFADHDQGVTEAIRDLVRQFRPTGKFNREYIHLWDCGIGDALPRAEFENNFTIDELIQAGNELAGDTDLKSEELQNLVEEESAKQAPSKKISKILGDYYYMTYGESLSKPRMGRFLSEIALTRIKTRGPDEPEYEFEAAIHKIGAMLQR